MDPIQSDYHSYLLRLWRVQGEEGDCWRASLEEVQTGELKGFADLAALVDYLEELACTSREDEALLEQEPDEGRPGGR